MKISKALVNATLNTGLPPIDVKFFPCRDRDGAVKAYYAMQILNTVEFGILTPSQFRVVAGRTNQCLRLGEKAIDKALLELRRRMVTLGDYDMLLLELPRKMLENGDIVSQLEERFATGDYLVRDKLCILFGSDILLTDPAVTVPRLNELKALGVRIGLADFGDESTSTLRLAKFPFELVLTDRSVAELVKSGNSAALGATVAFAHALGVKVLMDGALTDSEAASAFDSGVDLVVNSDVSEALGEITEEVAVNG